MVVQVASTILAVATRKLNGIAIEFEFVRSNRESIFSRHFFLKVLDLTILEFDDFVADRADQMVMMPFVRDVIELGLGSKVLFLRQAGLAQEFQRAVHGRQADMRVFFGEQPVHLLSGHMFHFEKGGEDVFPLPGQFETVF